MGTTTIGIDLAKSTFHLCGMDDRGHVLWRRRETRTGLFAFLRTQKRSRIVMEACGGAHHVAREARKMGHDPALISAKFVKPFVKSNKNDVVDAEAICEAGQRPQMRFVPIKTIERQDIQSLHRVRDLLIKSRTALVNQSRGLLLEYGITVPKGRHQLQKYLAAIVDDETGGLSEFTCELMRNQYRRIVELNVDIGELDKKLKQICKNTEVCQRLIEVPGIGYLTATALIAAIGNGSDFNNGRHFSAWIGIVPRQYSTGGKTTLLGISKRGDAYLRKLLIHGARSVLIAPSDLGHTQRWAREIKERTCTNKAAVALANKTARTAWAIMNSGEHFTRR